MKLSNFLIGTRLASAFALVMLLFGVTLSVGIFCLAMLNDNLNKMVNIRMAAISDARKIKDNANSIKLAIRDAIITRDNIRVEDSVKKISQWREENSQSLSVLTRLSDSISVKEAIKSFETTRPRFFSAMDRLMIYARENNDDEARALLYGEFGKAQEEYFAAVEALVVQQAQLAKREAGDAARTYENAKLLMLSLAACAVGLSAFMALGITRSVTRPIHEAILASKRIEAGDLSGFIGGHGKDEAGQLLSSLRSMQSKLSDVVSGVRLGAESVASASSQIAQGNLDLSQRTEEQASALEQTAATMDELGSTIKTTAENAKQASELALGASSIANQGEEVVSEVVKTMKAINESSKKVTDIIGVIDSIAFQTNILALNAAVEAARAGEQGRGFAVVASEVRNLAQRSAVAAKEIKVLIENSVLHVGKGTTLVNSAGRTMSEIMSSIHRVSQIAGYISEATKEQSTGISQVGDAVSQMDQVTQQNAALVEESAAAAGSLKLQAQQLVEAVAVFKLFADLGVREKEHVLNIRNERRASHIHALGNEH